MMIPINFDIFALMPLLTLVITSLLVMLTEAFMKTSEKTSYWLSICGLSVSIIFSFATVKLSGTVLQQMINIGGMGSIFSAMFSISALGTVILARDYLEKEGAHYGEFYLLILFSTIGMLLMATAADLIIIFLGLELMSICLYVLTGYMRKRKLSNESALKYFLLGSFATGFLLYGIALLYGASGSTKISFLIHNYGLISASPFFWVGLGFLFIGLAFKVGGVPFHMWVPDVYQGAPTPVAGFMSTGAKAAAFSAILIVFLTSDVSRGNGVEKMIAIVAALSMIVGNIVAISQTNLKRMLAYSSIAHAGYMLVGIAANNQLGKSGVIFYLFSYTFMNLGAFGILSLVEKEEKNLSFEDYSGLGFRHPLLAALMSMFLLSLAGIPPFAGFFGKYYVFVAAIDSGLTWLAILGVLMSVVSVYYYLRLIVFMYFREGEQQLPIKISVASYAVIIMSIIAIIELGIYPSSLLSTIIAF
jgi:NADH-quinone oxidoreductase subunit N